MLVGDIKDLQQNNSIIIGSWLASHLNINIGDSVSITTSDIKTTLLGSFPQSIKLKVVGLYELRSELDQVLVLISHSLAQKIQ